MQLCKLAPRFVERPWGSHRLRPWFDDSPDRRIGEVWFQGETPLLVKFLYATEDLSIQVHPGDEYARKHHDSNGKTEMWYVLAAEPGARVALGLNRAVLPDELRQAAESGEILSLMNWVPVKAGDTLLARAGQIHAIGGGVTVCEIQQISDVTYRLFDYGRGRELHLDHGIAVSNLFAYQPEPRPAGVLASCEYFQTDLIEASAATEVQAPKKSKPWLMICVEGSGRIGDREYRLGEVWEVPAGTRSVIIEPQVKSRFVRTFQP